MNIDEIMMKAVVRVSPDDTIGDGGRRRREKGVGCLVVTAAGAVKGTADEAGEKQHQARGSGNAEVNYAI